MDIESHLRSHRKRLVIAAEDAVAQAVQADEKLPDKTQLNRLVSICSEASCAEEITSYLRYQASRKTRPWPHVFAASVITRIDAPLDALVSALSGASEADCDRVRVVAWRMYAVFLARAFTYAQQIRDSKRGRP